MCCGCVVRVCCVSVRVFLSVSLSVCAFVWRGVSELCRVVFTVSMRLLINYIGKPCDHFYGSVKSNLFLLSL